MLTHVVDMDLLTVRKRPDRTEGLPRSPVVGERRRAR